MSDAASNRQDRPWTHQGCAKDLAAQFAGVFAGFPAEVSFGIGAKGCADDHAEDGADAERQGIARGGHEIKDRVTDGGGKGVGFDRLRLKPVHADPIGPDPTGCDGKSYDCAPDHMFG